MKRGEKHSSEAREKMRLKALGRTLSEETRRKVGENCREGVRASYTSELREVRRQAILGEKNPQFGTPLTEDRKEQAGRAMRGKKQSEEHKKKRGKTAKEHPFLLQRFLSTKSIEVKREVWFAPYRVDCYDRSTHTAYELDGEGHDTYKDETRDRYLERTYGLRVVRYKEEDLK